MLQHQVLETLGSARNYIAWLADLVEPYLDEDPIEVGAGLGDYAQRWLDRGLPRITLTEQDPVLYEALRSRFAGDDRVEVRELDVLRSGAGQHTATVMLNVLEHIDDDRLALARARKLGQRVVALVPAFDFAFGNFDREIGHHRRYTKKTLGSTAVGAGLEIEELRYVNAPGLLAWVVSVKWLGRRPHEGRALDYWDKAVVPFVRAFEKRVTPPFGQSLLLVAR
jgi:hypothetical protein